MANTTDLLKDNWASITEDKRLILGIPNFGCARIAHRMKAMGFDCRPKAEEEQAMVISTMLYFYEQHNESWGEEMDKWLAEG